MPRRLDIFVAELPPPGLARCFVVLSLVVGAAVAIGLTGLIFVFAYTALTS